MTRGLQTLNITRIQCEQDYHYCCKERKGVTPADKNPSLQPFPTARPSTTTTKELPDVHSKSSVVSKLR